MCVNIHFLPQREQRPVGEFFIRKHSQFNP